MTSDDFALQAWATAEYHLSQALMQPAEAAGATVHEAYYAMFHAARAALLRRAGNAPKKHASVIERFGLLVRDGSEPLRQAGRDLNRVETSRITPDCGQVTRLTAEDALDSVNKARRFVDLCSSEFGFPRGGAALHE